MVMFTVIFIPVASVYSICEIDIGLEFYSTVSSPEKYQADRYSGSHIVTGKNTLQYHIKVYKYFNN